MANDDIRGQDILGNALTTDEQALLAAYEQVLGLLDADDLPPSVSCNVKEAAAALWCAVNDLCLVDARPPT